MSYNYTIDISIPNTHGYSVSYQNAETFNQDKESLVGKKKLLPGIGNIYALRTDTVKHTITDLFVPNSYSSWKRETAEFEPTSYKILGLVPAIICDAILLPLRCLTLIPRIFYNAIFQPKAKSELKIIKLLPPDLRQQAMRCDRLFVTVAEKGQKRQFTVDLVDMPRI